MEYGGISGNIKFEGKVGKELNTLIDKQIIRMKRIEKLKKIWK